MADGGWSGSSGGSGGHGHGGQGSRRNGGGHGSGGGQRGGSVDPRNSAQDREHGRVRLVASVDDQDRVGVALRDGGGDVDSG